MQSFSHLKGLRTIVNLVWNVIAILEMFFVLFRELDISETNVTDIGICSVVDHCPLLSFLEASYLQNVRGREIECANIRFLLYSF